jgi:hypothetical protein
VNITLPAIGQQRSQLFNQLCSQQCSPLRSFGLNVTPQPPEKKKNQNIFLELLLPHRALKQKTRLWSV